MSTERVDMTILCKWELIYSISCLFGLTTSIVSNELSIWISPDTSCTIGLWKLWDTREYIPLRYYDTQSIENNPECRYLT